MRYCERSHTHTHSAALCTNVTVQVKVGRATESYINECQWFGAAAAAASIA